MRTIQILFLALATLVFTGVTARSAQAQEFAVRDGLFMEFDGGVFFSTGGLNGLSNASTFTGFEFGYDLTRQVALQFEWGFGGVANNCAEFGSGKGNPCTTPNNYSVMIYDVNGSFTHYFSDRVAVLFKLGGGGSKIDAPFHEGDPSMVMNLVFGTGIELQTKMKHIKAGVELTGFYLMAEPATLAFSVYPTLKYVF